MMKIMNEAVPYCTVLYCRLHLCLKTEPLPGLVPAALAAGLAAGDPPPVADGEAGQGRGQQVPPLLPPLPLLGLGRSVNAMSSFRNLWYLVFNTYPHLMAVLVPVVEPLLLPRGGPNAGELCTNQR